MRRQGLSLGKALLRLHGLAVRSARRGRPSENSVNPYSPANRAPKRPTRCAVPYPDPLSLKRPGFARTARVPAEHGLSTAKSAKARQTVDTGEFRGKFSRI